MKRIILLILILSCFKLGLSQSNENILKMPKDTSRFGKVILKEQIVTFVDSTIIGSNILYRCYKTFTATQSVRDVINSGVYRIVGGGGTSGTTNHASLSNLGYSASGHTGFQPTKSTDSLYFSSTERNKLSSLQNTDSTIFSTVYKTKKLISDSLGRFWDSTKTKIYIASHGGATDSNYIKKQISDSLKLTYKIADSNTVRNPITWNYFWANKGSATDSAIFSTIDNTKRLISDSNYFEQYLEPTQPVNKYKISGTISYYGNGYLIDSLTVYLCDTNFNRLDSLYTNTGRYSFFVDAGYYKIDITTTKVWFGDSSNMMEIYNYWDNPTYTPPAVVLQTFDINQNSIIDNLDALYYRLAYLNGIFTFMNIPFWTFGDIKSTNYVLSGSNKVCLPTVRIINANVTQDLVGLCSGDALSNWKSTNEKIINTKGGYLINHSSIKDFPDMNLYLKISKFTYDSLLNKPTINLQYVTLKDSLTNNLIKFTNGIKLTQNHNEYIPNIMDSTTTSYTDGIHIYTTGQQSRGAYINTNAVVSDGLVIDTKGYQSKGCVINTYERASHGISSTTRGDRAIPFNSTSWICDTLALFMKGYDGIQIFRGNGAIITPLLYNSLIINGKTLVTKDWVDTNFVQKVTGKDLSDNNFKDNDSIKLGLILGINTGDTVGHGLINYNIGTKVPTATTITINGTTQDLSTNRSWTVSGGLANFVESKNFATPNATIPVEALTATGAETDIDVAIVPKGVGSFSLRVADNTSSGGSKRGNYAVDLQTDRDNATQVAAGYASFAVGNKNTASGNFAIVMGTNNTASATNTIAVQNYAWADKINQFAIGCKGSPTRGKSQYSTIGVFKQTTDATPAEGSSSWTIASNKVFGFTVKVVCTQVSTNANCAFFERRGLIYNNGTTCALEGAIQTIGTDIIAAGLAGISIAITADNTNKKLVVMLTGLAATTLNWTTKVELIEVGQ